MSFKCWLSKRSRPLAQKPRRLQSRRGAFVKPVVELLEDRMAPAVLTVNTVADDLTPNDSSVSLREAITALNAGNDLGDPDIIAQAPGTFHGDLGGDAIRFNIPGGNQMPQCE